MKKAISFLMVIVILEFKQCSGLFNLGNNCLECVIEDKKQGLPLMSMGELLKLKSSPFPGLLQ